MLDTNILFSCMLFPTKQTNNFLEKLKQEEILISEKVVEELYDVVERKQKDKKDKITLFLNTVNYTLISTPKDFTNIPEIRDQNDLPILAAAIKSDADYFITGDKDFLTLNIKYPKILTMQEFIEA